MTLDEILAKHGAEPGEMTHSLKQAILRWVADEVIGEDDNYVTINWTPNAKGTSSVSTAKSSTNRLRAEQRKALKELETKPMTNYNERLDEVLRYSALNAHYKSWDSIAEAKQAILDLTNKRIEEVLDNIEASINNHTTPEGRDLITRSYVRNTLNFERNKLKDTL